MKEILKRFRPTSGILVTALLVLVIILGLFFLIRSGILVPHPGGDDTDSEQTGVLPQLNDPAETDILYREIRDTSPAELLDSLREADCYVWNFSFIEAWENRYTAERTTIRRAGEKYRIERENLLVICDGRLVYRREGMLETVCDASATDMYLEAGLTPLDRIRDDLDGCTVEYDNPVNPMRIRISRTRDGYRDEYEISIETGIPVIERSYVGNMAYRMVLTDSVTAAGADQLADEKFTIPDIELTGE